MDTENLDKLTHKNIETKEIITPYAFEVAPQMLGVPLASPIRRLLAMMIDVVMIFIAAKISAAIIAFVAALAFYKSTGEKYLAHWSHFTRRILKFTAAITLFVTAVALLDWSIENFSDENLMTIETGNEYTSQEMTFISQYLQNTEDETNCDNACRQSHFELLLEQVPKLKDEFSNDVIQNKGFEQFLLKLIMFSHDDDSENSSVVSDDEKIIDNTQTTSIPATKSKTYSLLEWAKGLLTDLGLGFGWAALYFTLFSVLWKGQTLGKKLCGIRVIRLDGLSLSLWDAFGRYGGYGAGFATGLLGFLQIYWDPNRQAIQDKISATVVIKGDIPVSFQNAGFRAIKRQ